MIKSPVLIIGCPRAGTSLLYNLLSEAPDLWSIGYESKEIIERYHHPSEKNWQSGALNTSDLTAESRAYMLEQFERQAMPGIYWRRINRFRSWLRANPLWNRLKGRGRIQGLGSGVSAAIPQSGLSMVRELVSIGKRFYPSNLSEQIRLLEKTPENCLRLPFLLALFPDARIIYLTREGKANVNSLMEGWRQPHIFPGYRVPLELSIPGYQRDRWAFALIPNWRKLIESSLEEICAWQWVRCNQFVLDYLDECGDSIPYLKVRYEDLTSDPQRTLAAISDFIKVDYQDAFGHHTQDLPLINVLSTPSKHKWQEQNREAIQRILPILEPTMQRLGYRI